ncbi:helix-turn-helix domain-containing protein [Rhodococcus hoagii]|nr:helix-turn-helix domain-containing protein [Prescottella equi]
MKNPHTSRSTTVARTTLLDRIGTVLDAFGSNSPLTGCDIMDSTRLPRTSTYRILEQLVAIGWLEREGNTHRLGTRLVELGSLALDQDPLAQAAEPHLLRLHRRTGLVVHLAVLDGTDVVYLRKVGDTLDRLSPTRTGLRVPAAGSVLGEALLGWADAGPTTLSRQHRRSMAVTANWHTSSPGSLPEVARRPQCPSVPRPASPPSPHRPAPQSGKRP